jgi:tetratricopeptide (TPR) repeat protein
MKLSILIACLCLSSGLLAQDNNLVVLGNKEMNDGNFRLAQDFYQAALAKDPQNWHIYTMLGFCYHKQRRFRDADSLYRIAVQNDSLNSKPFWYKGMNHIAMKQDSMVIVCYKRFIALEKTRGGNLVVAYRSIGQSYERMLRRDGLYSWQIDDMLYHYEQIEILEPSAVEVQNIRNFVEHVKALRPGNQSGKWKLEA